MSTFAGGDIDDPFPITRQKLSSLFVSDTIGFWNDRVLITGGIRLQEIGSKSYAANATGAIPAGGLTGKYSKDAVTRSEEHTSELQSLMRISYAVFCLKKKK